MAKGKKKAKLNELALWRHQKEAIGKMEEYISAYRNGTTDRAGLVVMPTGSGKSGVIAVLARCVSGVGLTLVLTPRKSLRDQLYRDIDTRFFSHVGYPTGEIKKRATVITEGQDLTLEGEVQNQVIVMTIQMLTSLAHNGDKLDRLVRETSLLIVDEGHYEPAKEWSKAIRKINSPKIIFTATPYRNDFKVFDIDIRYSYVFSFSGAQNERYLRQVNIVQRAPGARNMPAQFAADVVNFYNMTFPIPGDPAPRVIIRCDDSASIRHLAQALTTLGKTVIGVHETFRNDGGEVWERKDVPRPESENAIFWIHQFKLLEGIDDFRFRIVAIYEKIPSARSLVQQVGRIIRNPRQIANQIGYVLDYWGGFHSELWAGFLGYDRALADEGAKALELSTSSMVLPQLIDLQPKVAYIERRFRAKFDFNSISPLDDVQLPLRANVLKKLPVFDISKLVQAITDDFEEKDRYSQVYSLSEGVQVIVSIAYGGSMFLRNHTFMEADLHVMVVKEFTEYICMYDSSGMNLIGREDVGIGDSLDSEKLRKLFENTGTAKLTSVSLSNSNLGTSSIRSRTITAASIEATIPAFDDHAQICTTAEGYSCDEASGGPTSAVRRYVGFSRGTVSQNSPGYKPLKEYVEWLKKIERVIEGGTTSLPVLDRYALETSPPGQVSARSILLEIEDIKDAYTLANNDEEYIEIEDGCADIEGDKFKIIGNGSDMEVEIRYESGRYQLKSGELDSRYISHLDNFPPSIVKYFNRTQSFRVLPEDLSSVYVRGQFYKPSIKVGDDFNAATYALGYCFVPDQTIGACRSEKGNKTYYDGHDDDWDPDSLFGIISRCGASTGISALFNEYDILLCDDVGTEIADFILCDTAQPRVVFIHAKASSDGESNCSASGLQEVCAQAIKNLGYLAMFNDQKPSKLNSWDGSWTSKVSGSKGAMGTVQRRIRLAPGGMNAQSVWQSIRSVVNNPMVDKQVWLFLGNTLSKKYFEDELAKNSPKPHVVQAAYLLHATMTDVASVGAKLRLFCKE